MFPGILRALPTTVDLLDAVRSQQIQLTATGTPADKNPGASSHTGKCLHLSLVNRGKQPLHIRVNTGLHLQSLTEQTQDLVTTENLLVKLAPGGQSDVTVYALCAEKNNASPGPTDTFRLMKRHDGSIGRLSDLLAALQEHGHTAQMALWCLTNGEQPENVYDTHQDTAVENKLVHFLADELRRPVPSRPAGNPQRVRTLRYPLEIEGQHKEFLEQPASFSFHITDSANRIITTLVEEDRETRRGTIKFSFLYRGQVVAGHYYLKMRRNGAWVTLRELSAGPQ